MPRELSQNLKDVLKEIGEGAVLLKLSIALYDKPEWRVYRNYADDGCDLVVIGPSTRIKVEVKSRQNLITKNPNRRSVHFTITENEQRASDFLIAYWFDRSSFFIVPTKKLRRVRNGKKHLYKFIPYFSTGENRFTGPSLQYLNRWDLILNHVDPGHEGAKIRKHL